MTDELKQRIEQIASVNDWQCGMSVCTADGGTEYIEFETYTQAGQDLVVTIGANDFDSLSDVSCALFKYAENFDPDYEAYLWLGDDGHGKNGAPYHMGDVLEDMVSAKQMIYDLSDAFNE